MRRRRYQSWGELVLEAGYRAVLIREGTSQNGNRWTRTVLEQIAKLADGVKIRFYDFSPDGSKRLGHHWEALRRSLPPAIARLLPDALDGADVAVVRNARVELDASGVAEVVCDPELIASRVSLLEQVVGIARRMGKAVGISIHVPEDQITVRSVGDGTREPTEVRAIRGFDLVSQPSAGGRLVPVLEALQRRPAMKGFLKRLLRYVPVDKRAALEALLPKGWESIESAEALLEAASEECADALLEALGQAEVEEEGVGAVLEALAKAPDAVARPAERGKVRPKPKGKPKRKAATLEAEPEGEPGGEGEDDDVVDSTAREEIAEMRLDAGRTVIEACIDAAKLPVKLTQFAREQLGALLEAAGKITKKDCTDWLTSLKAGIGAAQASGGGLLESEDRVPHFTQQWSTGEQAECALEAMLDGKPFGELVDAAGKKTRVPAFIGIKQAYQVIQGDVFLEGLDFIRNSRRPSAVLESVDWESNDYFQLALRMGGAGLEATILTTGFVNILANIQNKRLAREYASLPHHWRLIASTVPVTDFKTRSIVRLGEFASLPVVLQDAAYVDLGLPTEEEVTAQIAKRGGLAPISWESIVNDDLKVFRQIPKKLAGAADRTLNEQVWGKLLTNSAWDGDATAVFHANHNNLIAAAYSFAQLKVARRKATLQKDMNAKEAGRIKLERVFVGPQIFDAVYEDMFSDGKPNLELGTAAAGDTENPGKANVIRSEYGWSLHEIHQFNEVAGSELDVIIGADPNVTEMMEVGFLNGNETPQLFVQDMQNVGSFFTNDRVINKVRHVHDDGTIVDPKGFQLIQQP